MPDFRGLLCSAEQALAPHLFWQAVEVNGGFALRCGGEQTNWAHARDRAAADYSLAAITRANAARSRSLIWC